MSLTSAVHESAQEVLREVLAPEMSERLAQAIVDKTQARLEPLIAELFGVETVGKRKGGKARRERVEAEAELEMSTGEDAMS